ncbi:MAG: glycosyltransferase, partial [Nitrosomonas sp.]|nr:glycosyltransferase [Nitrosomonas sp.]
MRIAQVSPLIESVPPKGYGGIERVVSYLTEELVSMGHEVTLFASGDSITEAKLEVGYPRALRLDPNIRDHQAHHLLMFEKVFAKYNEFDVIHFHTGYSHFPLCRRHTVPQLTTHHGRLDLPELFPLFREFEEMPLVSISNSQRQPIPWANWVQTVHNALPDNLFSFFPKRGNYLAFLGRISPEKRVDRAIEIARRTGMTIKIAAKVDKVDIEYFDSQIKPLLKDPLV